MAQITIQVGHDYEVSGDGTTRHNGQVLNGVYLNDAGAWAGIVRCDEGGWWLDIVDDDGDFIAAKDDWADHIIRDLPGPALAAGDVAA